MLIFSCIASINPSPPSEAIMWLTINEGSNFEMPFFIAAITCLAVSEPLNLSGINRISFHK